MQRWGSVAAIAAKSLTLGGALLTTGLWSGGLDAQSAPPAGSVGGLGDINLFPKRVVLDSRVRVASVGLFNKTTTTGDYEILVSDRMMTEDGQLVDLAQVVDAAAKARVRTASSFLRWSPRKVALRGSEAQTVRIMARITPDLPPGEYRSHFQAIALPPTLNEGGSIEAARGQSADKGIGVRILPRFGISIPIIVRVGATTLTTGLKDFALVKTSEGQSAFRLTITREGTRSAFGNITVTVANAKKTLAEVKGIGVYTEISQRHVVIPVDPTAMGGPLRAGTRVTVTYTDDDFAPGKILSRQEFVVP